MRSHGLIYPNARSPEFRGPNGPSQLTWMSAILKLDQVASVKISRSGSGTSRLRDPCLTERQGRRVRGSEEHANSSSLALYA
jgi:hypothetical protein